MTAIARRGALALAGLLAAGGGWAWLGQRRRAPAPHDLHRRYRVAFDVPPVDAALWFIQRYSPYFTGGERGLGPWLDGLDPRARDFVLAMAQTLTWAWVEHELPGLGDPGDLDAIALRAIAVVRGKTLNQFEVTLDDRLPDIAGFELSTHLGATGFGAGVFGRLVRGASNCEGQNHLLAVLLAAKLGPRYRVTMAGLPGHELVAIDGPGLAATRFADAWSNLPPFSVERRPDGLRLTLPEDHQPVVPELPGRAPASPASYANASRTVVELIPARDAVARPVDLEIRAPSLHPTRLAKLDRWRLLLSARALHLFDDPRAGDLYRSVLVHHCPAPRTQSFACMASSRLLARLPE